MAETTLRRDRTWSFNVLRSDDDTDWPDELPQPYSSVGRMYRPVRVHLVFSRRNDEQVKLTGSAIYGPRIVKAGPVGSIVTQSLYGTALQEPWFMEIVTASMGAIMQDLSKGAVSE